MEYLFEKIPSFFRAIHKIYTTFLYNRGNIQDPEAYRMSKAVKILALTVALLFLSLPLLSCSENEKAVATVGEYEILYEELRFVTRTYNQILQENRAAREKLSHEASHDALTGLFNRGAYDLMMESVDTKHMALILIDVDYFKTVNDTYGHAVGDRVLKRVAELLKSSFRSVDVLCRIGGDEFAVIMTRANSSMSQLVLNKMNRVNDILQHPKDDLPPVSLSVGIAFSDREDPQGDIFSDADSTLYEVKEAGRRGCAVFGYGKPPVNEEA
jgi:diguanylate cyclase (GGDEF)-like protein